MSQTIITVAFEQWKAREAVTGEPVLLDEFVFANVPGINPDQPIDRNETLPPESQIVHRQAVSRKGVVNANAVVHSVVLDAGLGDFSFNWIGLINKASGTLAMIVHAPVQQKLKTKEGQQGNVLTRSFLMEYNGAQVETGINTPAETWQIDFTARMAGIDERQREENSDIYGDAAFFEDGYLVGKTGNQFFVTKGTAYVAGLRTVLAANQNITVATKPVKIWLDVCWAGTLTSVWRAQSKITVAESLAHYVQNGVQHYVFAVASIDQNGNITDLRPKGALNEQKATDALKKHEQSRNHPDASTTERGFTKLSSATDSDSEALSATPKAVKLVNDNANKRVPSTRKINGYDLSGDVNLSADDVDALPVNGGRLLGNLTVEGIDYITKNQVVDSGNSRSTLGLRLRGVGGQRVDDLFYEEKGIYAAKRFFITSGGKESVFDLRMDGSVVVNHPGGEMIIFPDGNIKGSIWNGYLSAWVNGLIADSNKWVSQQIAESKKWVSDNFASIAWARNTFINDIRLGYDVVLTKPAGRNTFSAPPGHTFTFIDVGDGNEVVANASPLQKNYNGTWYTVQKL